MLPPQRVRHYTGLAGWCIGLDLGYFRFLRVLDVVNANSFGIKAYVSLPAQVFDLFHSRYLAFDYPMKIPASISNLQNLQTLIIDPRNTYPLVNLEWLETSLEIYVIVGSLPNLQVLKLRHFTCQGDKWETTEGDFPQLKFLLIHKSDLRHWITESSHFPSLKSLLLHYCRHLSEIPDGIGEIPTLELIEVKYSRKSLVESAKRIQEEQQGCGNDALQVCCKSFKVWDHIKMIEGVDLNHDHNGSTTCQKHGAAAPYSRAVAPVEEKMGQISVSLVLRLHVTGIIRGFRLFVAVFEGRSVPENRFSSHTAKGKITRR
ncbi:hypothetical protein Pfo_015746 [Paulownia fortunei]|nr:hypothetical protein Pfo_015746 [Paulownia fortunei]